LHNTLHFKKLLLVKTKNLQTKFIKDPRQINIYTAASQKLLQIFCTVAGDDDFTVA